MCNLMLIVSSLRSSGQNNFIFQFIIMRILLVEDNVTIAQNIQEFFALENITIDCAYDGEQGRDMYQTNHYDLLIIDRMLPKMSGVDLCTSIRTSSEIPMIMLTAKGEIADKLEGFDR